MEQGQERIGGASAGGRRARAETRHPVYSGVRLRAGKWVSEIQELRNPSRIWLGTYPTPEMAAAAYDAAALALRGAGMALNFPDAARSRPAPASTSTDDVRAAAAVAAEAVAMDTNDGSDRRHELRGNNGDADEGRDGMGAMAGVVGEDDVFKMPRLMVSLAEGLMMSPPVLGHAAADVSASLEDEDGSSLWDHWNEQKKHPGRSSKLSIPC